MVPGAEALRCPRTRGSWGVEDSAPGTQFQIDPLPRTALHFVAVAIVAVHDSLQRWVVERLEMHRVPFDAAPFPPRQIPQQDRLGEWAGVIREIGHGRLF